MVWRSRRTAAVDTLFLGQWKMVLGIMLYNTAVEYYSDSRGAYCHSGALSGVVWHVKTKMDLLIALICME